MNQVVYKNCFTSTLKILFYVVFLVNKLGINLNLDFSMKWVKFKHNNASMDERLRMIYKNIHLKKKIQSYNGGMKIWILDIFVGNIMTVAMLSIKTKESRINKP